VYASANFGALWNAEERARYRGLLPLLGKRVERHARQRIAVWMPDRRLRVERDSEHTVSQYARRRCVGVWTSNLHLGTCGSRPISE
jgi:hypothetical protein